jgi:hypothetical protein
MFGGKKEFNTQDTEGTEKRWRQPRVSSWKQGQPLPFHAIENNRPAFRPLVQGHANLLGKFEV